MFKLGFVFNFYSTIYVIRSFLSASMSLF